ncbi:MAG: elongation factor G-like protein EF-G2 [Actinomycetota bacterium]|nr:elongation factor G-like protein EF-G2 [Actinomycetota bacterium]
MLVGHSGAGKTALAEALLAAAGVIGRPGRVEDGTTVCDSDPVEVAGKRSVGLALAAFPAGGVKVNLLDAPGYPDFVGELRAGLRAADAALFVVGATQGVDAVTAALWEECAAAGTPRAVVVTGLDSPRADFEQMVAICARVFGEGGEVVPASLPLLADDGSVAGLLDLLRQRVVDASTGQRVERDPDPEHLTLVAEARGTLIEAVIAESEDETLLDRYLAGEEIDVDVLVADLESAVARGHLHPVLPVSAPSAAAPCGVGVEEVLELVLRGFPCPAEREPLPVTRPDGRPDDPVTCDPEGPLVAEVIRTTTDPYVGRLSLLRVFSGTLRPDASLHVSGHVSRRYPKELSGWHPDHDSDERAGALASPLGARLRPVGHAVAGDLVTVARLAGAETGDTVSSRDRPLLVAPWPLPEPWLPVALTVPGGEEEKLAAACARLVAEDPTLRLERSPTGQLLLWCVGEAQVQVALTRLAERHGLAVTTQPVRLPLQETVAGLGTGTGRLVKQSGGHGQYAVLTLEVEPLPAGSGLAFDSRITGGAVPAAYLAAAERGIRARAARGLHDGWPLVDVKITALDGKTHSVDSSDQAFATAGAMALEEACTAAGRVLLEPVLEVEVRVPAVHLGAVLGDLATRRARVTGTDPSPEGGPIVVRAEVPEAEALRYAAVLRSLTHGTASFSRRPLRHEPVPPQARERVLAGV